LLAYRARMDLDRGRWDQAADGAELVLRDPRSAPLPRGQALTTVGLVRTRRGDPGASEPLAEGHRSAWATEEVHQIGPVTAARAEAAWLAGEAPRVRQETDAALALARGCRARWVVGDLAYWRRRAGVRERIPTQEVAEPYALSLGGQWAEAATMWREIGCPYEAALALSDADQV